MHTRSDLICHYEESDRNYGRITTRWNYNKYTWY